MRRNVSLAWPFLVFLAKLFSSTRLFCYFVCIPDHYLRSCLGVVDDWYVCADDSFRNANQFRMVVHWRWETSGVCYPHCRQRISRTFRRRG